jgi:hypothetical protein
MPDVPRSIARISFSWVIVFLLLPICHAER